jgi:hypothetical protein
VTNTEARRGPGYLPRERVCLARAGVGQPDRHVDRDDLQRPVLPGRVDKVADPGLEVEARIACRQDNPDPSRRARVDPQHPLTAHQVIMAGRFTGRPRAAGITRM